MTLTEVIQVAAAIVVSLGGGGAIVMLCASWLGKVWANRILESDRRKYAEELERVRFELGRASLVHKAQYETEFRAYEVIWQHVIDVQRTVVALRPMFDQRDPKESDEERRSRRHREFVEPFNAMQAAIWKSKPFYSAAVHRELQELSHLIHSEAIDYQHGHPDRDPDYWQEAMKNLEAISNKIDAVCEAIRQRVSGSDTS